MKYILSLLLIFFASLSYAQNRNNIWCFGDSAGINFNNLSNPIPIHSSVNSRGTCVSICDSSGQLLFYSAPDADVYLNGGPPFKNGEVYNRYNNLMVNGDLIIMGLWYHEAVIVDNPANSEQYYLFTIGVTGNYGLYYSVIDMSLDSGRGAVIQKNIQLMGNKANDGLIAIKHGNGRDWWVVFRNYGIGLTDIYNLFLVTPSGITGPFVQNIGTILYNGFMRYSFNKTGDKLAVVTLTGMVETFDFDRCTGLLSNHTLIHPNGSGPNVPPLWSCAFSPNGRFLYVSCIDNPVSHIIQIDLLDSTPWNNCDTIWKDSVFVNYAGDVKLGPDNKVYFSCAWDNGINWNFPLPDTIFNNVITNLSVINSPDSLGAACDIQPYSFYLGGKRTYYGLPNNPDYDMPPIQGSPCDTLQWTGLPNPLTPSGGIAALQTTYISEWQKLFVNAQNIKGKNCVLKIFDVNGREVYSVRKNSPSGAGGSGGYFTQDVDVSGLASGMYLVNLITEKEMLSAKFVKEN